MCGIAGFIGKSEIEFSKIQKTLELMKRRGPDHQDFAKITVQDTVIYLLHSRLGIIDLDSRSNQPFTLQDCTLVYNGEIYNYIELKRELEAQGQKFTTNSDTEVLLRYYLKYGEDCVRYFEGMWSFALYDKRNGKLLLSRDRFAEKPLYYYETPQGIYFGSQTLFIKSLCDSPIPINEQQMLRFLVNGYKSLYKNGETFLKGVKEVPFASQMTIDLKGRKDSNRYWTPVYRPQSMTWQESVEGLRERLFDSIRMRLRSDVPMAFCLSGGVDSSALTSIAAKKFNYDVMAFSIIDPDDRYNERENIQATVADLGCRHHWIELQHQNVFQKLKELIRYHDAPLYTITYYVHALLLEAISERGFRVAVAGTGADELVTGYYDHFLLHLAEIYGKPEYADAFAGWQQHILPIIRNSQLKDPDCYLKNPNFRHHNYDDQAIFESYLRVPFHEAFTEEQYSSSLLRNRMMNEMFHEAVPVALHDDDLNSMNYSVENRAPFLDSQLFQFAYSIPPEYLIRDGYAKAVLRESAKGWLNEKVRTDRTKKGFNASLHSLIDFKDPANQEWMLADSEIFDFIDREKIKQLIQQSYFSNSCNKFLFSLINIKLFLEHCRISVGATS